MKKHDSYIPINYGKSFEILKSMEQDKIKKLLDGAAKISAVAAMVLDIVKSMPRSQIEDAIQLGEMVSGVMDANKKLCEVVNGIIDRKNETEKTSNQ